MSVGRLDLTSAVLDVSFFVQHEGVYASIYWRVFLVELIPFYGDTVLAIILNI